MAATVLAAICCLFFMPFVPKIAFSHFTVSEQVRMDGSTFPVAVVKVQNTGFGPVWYNGSPDSVHDFSYYDDGELDNWNGQHVKPVQWTRLAGGGETFVRVPIQDSGDRVRVAIRLFDWRGRSADCTSDRISNPTGN